MHNSDVTCSILGSLVSRWSTNFFALKMHIDIWVQKKAGERVQERIFSGQNGDQKMLAVFLISTATVSANLSTSLQIISDGVKERDSVAGWPRTRCCSGNSLGCCVEERLPFLLQPQGESKGETGRCKALYCGGLWH